MPYLSEAYHPDAVVTVEGLTFSYASRQVLHGISLIAVGIQYLLFRSAVAVALVTLIVGVGARFLTRAVVADFAARIRLQLQRAASGSVPLYREVE